MKNNVNLNKFKDEIDRIVKEYLFSISSLKNHNHFIKKENNRKKEKSLQAKGFAFLYEDLDNGFVVEEENFLEGCTRVFLINPIFKTLMDLVEIPNDWCFGTTFANYTISNREYELGNFIEFIAVLDGIHIGVRYTKSSYTLEESTVMDRDYKYLYKKEKIPGFEVLNTVEKVYVLNWQGITDEDLRKINKSIHGTVSLKEDISIKKFFERYFSHEVYEIIEMTTKAAVKKAKDIIALAAVPQLLPNNMLVFKQSILEMFCEKRLSSINYEFQSNNNVYLLSIEDSQLMNERFFILNYRNALIGKEDFAKSFITSEYLFSTIKEGLNIDYTSVVVGYLKSVEQLLYLIYISAFEGKSKLEYWDRCNRKENFDLKNSEKYRYEPYNYSKKVEQEKYYHRIKLGEKAPEFGELTRFLRYNDRLWRISESGKEYIFKCLEDFRGSCRNSHFHKDNIDVSQYDKVKRIRNNTHLCLYYLLTGFKFLDSSKCIEKQLGIIDYKFELFYLDIRQRRRRFFMVDSINQKQYILCYLNDDTAVEFNESGMLVNMQIKFLKLDLAVEHAYIDELLEYMTDELFVEKNSIYINRNNMPSNIKAFYPKKIKK